MLSVVVVALEGGEALRATLAALRTQEPCGGPVEVLVACDETIAPAPGGELADGVRLVRVPGAVSPAEMRAVAVAQTRAPIVALTEDHCVPAADWCARIVAAHRLPRAAIGGAIEKREPDDSLGWAVYFADYSRYMLPLAAGAAPYLSDCNVSYKREALERVRHRWSTAFHETVVHAALHAAHEETWLDPSIVVHESRQLPLGDLLRDRYRHGRLFAALRSTELGRGRRLTMSAMALGLPVLSVGRIAARTVARRRAAGRLLASLPALVLLSAAWAAGECTGYATGRPPNGSAT